MGQTGLRIIAEACSWFDRHDIIKGTICSVCCRGRCVSMLRGHSRHCLDPSGRRLAYVKPRMGINKFGSESVTYEGVGSNKKWERLESYGPKFVENATQAIARDILMFAMETLRNCSIVGHVHDEVIIEARQDMSLEAVCQQMGRTPPWAKGLLLRADGYECGFYKKD